jgi:RNA polymerase primary sigma factor
MWLREIGRTPLLSIADEAAVARLIARGRRAAILLNDADEGLTPDEHASLQKIVDHGDRARETLIRANLRLVVAVARRYANGAVPMDDLIQEGNIGLLRAVEKFDHSLGHRFSTYAVWWIRQAVTRAIADQGRCIRVPSHMVACINRVVRATGRLAATMGREPTTEEIAAETGLPVERVRETSRVSADAVSLEVPCGDGDVHLGDMLVDMGAESPMDSLARAMLQDQLDALLREVLTERERQVLALRFGLRNGTTRTLEEVGSAVGVTRERVRQIEIRAMHKLRQRPCAPRLLAMIAHD